MKKKLFFLVVLLVTMVAGAWGADPDLKNDYTLVKSVTWGDGTAIDGSEACSYTAYETGNARQQSLTVLSSPKAAAGWIAMQGWTADASGKGWWNRESKSLYCVNGSRSAAVFGDDLRTGWLVVFDCTQDASAVMTLTNAEGNPDGTFTYAQSEDTKSYYCTINADYGAYVGFCGVKNTMGISKISVYKPAGEEPEEPVIPDLAEYDLVKSVTWGGETDLTRADAALTQKTYNSENNVMSPVYPLTAPTDAAGWIAVQGTNSQDTKGWWNRASNGLWSYNATRSAAVYGDDLDYGWLVVFECTQDATAVMTLENASGDPDGTFTYVRGRDGKTFYCTINAEKNAYVGFCGKKSVGYISKISVYKPKSAVVENAEITKVELQGNFATTGTDWNAVTLTGQSDNVYTGILDLTGYTDDKSFKLVVNGGGSDSDGYAGWIGTNNVSVDAPKDWVVSTSETDNGNLTLNNSQTGYQTYTVTATWEPNVDYYKGWSLKIEGKDARKYAVSVADGITNGTVTVDKTEAAEGEEVTVTATPAKGYELDAITVTGKTSNQAVTVTDGKFSMIADAVTVSATFKAHVHEFVLDPAQSSEPSCTEPGKTVSVCICGEKEEVEIPALGHNFVDGVCTRCKISEGGTTEKGWLLTTPDKLATGDIVVIVDQTSSKAMSNDKGTTAAPAAESVTLSEDKSSITDKTVAANIQWVVTVSEGSYQFNVKGTENYLYVTATNNGVRVGAGDRNAYSIVTGGDNGGYYLYNLFIKEDQSGDKRYVGCYNEADWRCYTSINANIKGNNNAFYKKYGEDAVAAPVIEGETPFIGSTTVTITCETEGAAIYYTTDGTDPTNESTAYVEPFELTATATVKAIAYDVTGANSDVASKEFVATPTVANIAALNALEDKTAFAFTGEALVVAKAANENKTYVYIKDETGSSLIYDADASKTEAAVVGKTIAANWTGKVSIFKNLFEAVPDAALSVKDGEAVEVTYPEAQLTDVVAENVSQVVELKGVTYMLDGKSITIYKGQAEAVGYNQFGMEIAAAEDGKTYNIVGAVSRYNNNIQFWPISIEVAQSEPAVQLPGDVIWTRTEPVAATWYTEEAYDINIGAVVFGNAKVGDKIHVLVDRVAEGLTEDWQAQVSIDDGYWTILEKSVNVGLGDVKVASFVLTGDMLRLIQANGMKIAGSNFSTSMISLESCGDEPLGSNESIWVGNTTSQAVLDFYHFKNANNKKGVKAGDIIRVTAIGNGGWMIAQYSGEDTNHNWTDYQDMPAIQTETGFDFVVPKSNVQQILTDGVIINHGGYTITQVELIPSHPVVVAGAVGDKSEGAADILFGQAWKLLDDNEMKQDATSALYVKTYENVVFTEAATINCKVVLDDVWYGTADGANVTFDIPEAGTYNVEVTFDATTHEVAINVVKHVALTLLYGPNISSNEFDKYDDDVKVILSIANETEPYESRNTWGIGQGSNIGNWSSTDNSIVLTGKDGETFDIMITVGDLKRAAKNGTDAYIPTENNPEGGVTFNIYNGCALTGVTILAPVTNDKPAPLYVIGDISTGGWVRTAMTQMEYNLQTQAYEYSFTIDNEFAAFAFATYQMTEEEAQADQDWSTFNAEYRWAVGDYDIDASDYVNGDAVQLVKGTTNGTVKLPKGTYTVSVDPETMMMTITGTIAPGETFEYDAVYVAGNGTEGSAWMNGVTWNPLAEDNKMTKVDGTDDVWEITFKDVPASSGDEGYQLKFIPSGQWSADESTTWSVNFGGDFIGYGIETPAAFNSSNNIVFTTTAEQQDITLRIDLSNYDPTTNEGATFTVIAPKEQNTYVVAGCVGEKSSGEDDLLFGKAWDGAAEANQLAYDETSKLFTKTYEAVAFEGAADIFYKIVINGKRWVPDGENLTCEIPAADTYDITVTYDAETGEATMTATLTPVDIVINPEDITDGDITAAIKAKSEGKNVKNITINLAEGGEYTLSASIEGFANVTINGNGATIDASALEGNGFINYAEINGEFAMKDETTASAYIIVDNVTIKDVTINGLGKSVINNASGKKTLFKSILVDNSVIEIVGNNNVFALGTAYANNLNIEKSTIWSKDGHKGFFFKADGKPADVNASETTIWTVNQSTLYNIAVGKKANNSNGGIKGKKTTTMELTNSILYNFGSNKGSEVNGWLWGQNGGANAVYANNTYWSADGEVAGWTDATKGGSDQTGTQLTTDPGFRDAANGDFALASPSAQAQVEGGQTGDPRWGVWNANTITIADDIKHGSVVADMAYAGQGTVVTITATPDENYKLERMTVEGEGVDLAIEVTMDDENPNVGTFTMPAGPVIVRAEFKYVIPAGTHILNINDIYAAAQAKTAPCENATVNSGTKYDLNEATIEMDIFTIVSKSNRTYRIDASTNVDYGDYESWSRLEPNGASNSTGGRQMFVDVPEGGGVLYIGAHGNAGRALYVTKAADKTSFVNLTNVAEADVMLTHAFVDGETSPADYNVYKVQLEAGLYCITQKEGIYFTYVKFVEGETYTAPAIDVDALKAEIAAAKKLLGKDDVTVNPGKALNDAITAATDALKAVNAETTQETVDKAVTDLQAAEEAYKLAVAKSELSDEIAKATELLGEASTDVGTPGATLKQAIDDAQAVLDSTESTLEDINKAIEDLQAAEDAYITTGIDGVNASKYADGEWYTTGGVRVDKPTKKGLYIQNGRKVVMK